MNDVSLSSKDMSLSDNSISSMHMLNAAMNPDLPKHSQQGFIVIEI